MPIDSRLIPTPQDPTTRLMNRLAEQEARIAALERSRAGSILDTQIIRGYDESYSGGFSTTYWLERGPDASKMLLNYTPTVDVWWEVHGHIGLVLKADANYNYAYGRITITPSDALSVGSHSSLVMQHNGVQTYEPRDITALFKLNAGITYQAQLWLDPSGGTWQFYRGPQQLALHAKAWAR